LAAEADRRANGVWSSVRAAAIQNTRRADWTTRGKGVRAAIFLSKEPKCYSNHFSEGGGKMLHKTIRGFKAVAVVAMVGTFFVGCTDDDNPAAASGTSNPDAYLVTRQGQGVSYIQAVNVSEVTGTNVSQDNATQVQTDWGRSFGYKGKAYLCGYDMAEVPKYGLDSDGKVVKEDALPVGANSWASCIAFHSDTKAYLSLYGSGEIVVFDPTAMTRTTTIDINGYIRLSQS
jgi:hypothetical protein